MASTPVNYGTRYTQQWGPWLTTRMTPPPAYIETQDDMGILYFWSPLMIVLIVLACIAALLLIFFVALMIYNYCTYGICCCPNRAGEGSRGPCLGGPCCCCLWCMPAPPQPTKVIHRRRMSHGGGDSCRSSIRSSKSECDGSCGNDDVIVVRRPSMDRKSVRIVECPTIRDHTVRVNRPISNMSEICLVPQELPQPQPIIIQAPPAIMAPPAPPPQPQQPSFQGGELRVIIGSAQQASTQSNRIVYNMNQAPSSNHHGEYVLTSVDGNGSRLGGFNKGFDQQDNCSCFSDGQRSAVIDIGRIGGGGGSGGNTFYPSLPNYDD